MYFPELAVPGLKDNRVIITRNMGLDIVKDSAIIIDRL